MAKWIKTVVGVITLIVVVFIGLVVFGVFTALDSATKQYAPTSENLEATSSVQAVSSNAGFGNPFPNELDSLFGEVLKGKNANTVPALLTPDASDTTSDTTNSKKDSTFSSEGGKSDNKVVEKDTSSSSSSSTKKPVWHEPIYQTIEHKTTYKTVSHEAIYNTETTYYTTCNDCTFKVQGSIYPHQDATGHGRYSTNVPFQEQVLVKEAWDEQVVDQEAWTEKILIKEGYWE